MSSDNEKTRVGKMSPSITREDATVVRKPAHDPNNLSTITQIPEVAPKVVSVPLVAAEPKKTTNRGHSESTAVKPAPKGPFTTQSKKKSPLVIVASCFAALFILWFLVSRSGKNSHSDDSVVHVPASNKIAEHPSQHSGMEVHEPLLPSSEKQVRRMTASEFGSHFRRTIEENR